MAANLLIVLGGIIALGFIGNFFFERTRTPDILLLIGIGFVLGPVTKIVPVETLRPFMPAFGAVALTIILFEGGLDLNLQQALIQAWRAVLLAFISFTLSMFVIYYTITIGFNIGGRSAWALSAALACTSAPIVIPLIARIVPHSPMRPLLVVESALSDALAVMAVLTLMNFKGQVLSSSTLLRELGYSLLIGGSIALVSGFLWLWSLSRLYNLKFFYLLTLGFVFLMMGAVEHVHGSGAIAVLIFGMVLANGQTLMGILGPAWKERISKLFHNAPTELNPRISESHAEVAFLVRTFFFIYLGVIFRWPGSDFRLWLTILLVILAVIVSREVSVQILGWISRVSARNRMLLSAMLPRGLATAVLTATLALRNQQLAGAPETLATFIILMSNVWTTLRIMKFRKDTSAEAAEVAP
jgi:cell volume regulation protein A